MNARQTTIEAVKAADEFFARRLWQRIANEQIIGIDLEGAPPIVACVMGAAGREFGVQLLIGDDALREMLAITRGELHHRALCSESLSFSLERRVRIQPPYDRPLLEAGRQGRMAPLFFIQVQNEPPRLPRKAEFEILVRAVRAILIADAAGRLDPGDPTRTGRLLKLRVSGSLQRPDVAVDVESVPDEIADAFVGSPEMVDSAEITREFMSLPLLDAHYGVAITEVPVQVDGLSGPPSAVIIYDITNDRVVGMQLLEDGTANEAFVHVMTALHVGHLGRGDASAPAGRPKSIVVTNDELFAMVAANLQPLGVDCISQSHVPELASFLESMETFVAENVLPQGASIAEGCPADDEDLDAWKDVDFAVTERLIEAGLPAALKNEKAWRRYLGVDRDERNALLDQFGEGLVTGYYEWFAFYYRATKRSRAIVDRVLAMDLSDAERVVLEARRDARLSFYLIERLEVGEGVEVRDLLTDEVCFVHDKAMSTSSREGVAFPARLFEVGAFLFSSPAGPALPGSMMTEAMDALRDEHGLHLDDGVEPVAAHLVGRLWAWSDARARRGIQLQNFDGDPLLLHAASYAIADAAAFVAAIEGRDDIDELEPGSEWNWFRDRSSLARLSLLGTEDLLVETNSSARNEAAREWLEAIDGVTFQSVEATAIDPLSAASPGGGAGARDRGLDDRLPQLGPISDADSVPDEALAMVQQMIDEKCMAWLDESIPALGGKSPRQTCTSAEGRRKVTQMIRTYPDPGGIPGVRIPRERMLAELGLGDGGGSEGAAEAE